MPGAIELQKGVQVNGPASPGTVRFGVDNDGNPVIVDEEGVVRPSASLDGSPLSFEEQSVDPTTDANEMKVFAKRVEGVLGLYKRNESNGPVSEFGAGGGGGGTFFDDAESFQTFLSLAPSETQVVNTGVVPVLGTNQMMFINLEFMGSTGLAVAAGFLQLALAWAAEPSVPGSLAATVVSQENFGNLGGSGLLNAFQDVALNASGELEFTFTEQSGTDPWAAAMKFTVAPAQEFPFDPTP